MKAYIYRIIWIIGLVVFVILGLCFQKTFIETQKPLDYLSYWGTIATLLGLLIAILEVLHNSKTSKSIEEKVNEVLRIDLAVSTADCCHIIDSIIDKIEDERYVEIAIQVRELRRLLLRVNGALITQQIKAYHMNFDFGLAERNIEAYRSSSAKAPITKTQRIELRNYFISLKHELSITEGVK